jgi:V-type H+-transporting ATPase subunit a
VKKKAPNLFFEEIEEDVTSKEKFIYEQSSKLKEMHDNYNSLLEYKAVLNKAKKSINKDSVSNINLDEENDAAGAPLIHGDDVRVAYMAGTIFKAEQLRFKKMIFRATRGNALCDFEDLKMELKDYSGKN